MLLCLLCLFDVYDVMFKLIDSLDAVFSDKKFTKKGVCTSSTRASNSASLEGNLTSCTVT